MQARCLYMHGRILGITQQLLDYIGQGNITHYISYWYSICEQGIATYIWRHCNSTKRNEYVYI